MLSIKKELGIAIGYSDHTMGIELPIAAVALGARVIEKHFTLDRTMSGPDHLASLEPDELKQMVSSIRNIEKAIAGSGIKEPSLSEAKNKKIARKSICLSKAIEAKTILTEEHLRILRPGSGISPMEIGRVLGKKTTNSLPEGHILTWNDLK
jgi:N,N'-diacetyllegionaminate synthase